MKKLRKTALGRYNKTIFLTYDDGPSSDGKVLGDTEIRDLFLKTAITDIIPDYNFLVTPTENLLNLLKAHNINAIFFILGKSLKASENGTQQIQRMINEGHLLGNHSYSHKLSTSESMDWVIEDMIKSHNLITQLTHIPLNIYRPPYGAWNSKLTKKVWGNHILKNYIFPIMWSDSFRDWYLFDDPQITEKIRDQVTNFLERSISRSGPTILLHDPWIYSLLVTAELIRQAPQYGFKFGRVEKLIRYYQENLTLCRKSPYRFYLCCRLRHLTEKFTSSIKKFLSIQNA